MTFQASPASSNARRIAVALSTMCWTMGTVLAQSAPAADATASAESSPAKKALVARIVKAQQGGIEALGRSLAEQPAQQLVINARGVLQRVPQDKREALSKELDAELKKYVEEAVPITRDRAVAVAPTVMGPILEQRFTEAELKQLLALLESPVQAKYQQVAQEMQRAMANKVVTDTRERVEPKVRALEQAVVSKMRAAAPGLVAPASASGAGK
jgi:uncharacterized protein